jgi:flagellar protein FlgJ
MISQSDISGKLALDTKGLDQLRNSAKKDAPDALKGTAQQFEALFMNMVMKSMREATPHDGPFDSEQEKTFTSMLDQQLSQNLAKRGVGLADVLVRQLSSVVAKQSGQAAAASGALGAAGAAGVAGALTTTGALTGGGLTRAGALNITGALTNGSAASGADDVVLQPFAPGRLGNARFANANRLYLEAARQSQPAVNAEIPVEAAPVDSARRAAQPSHVRAFQDRLGQHAEQASRETGIPAKFMLGQAALESGWGRKEIVSADGQPSHNLFGIKATSGWKGKVVEATTTEYTNGVPHSKREKFRAYDSYAEGFRDYAKMLSKNPRYGGVIANSQDATSFAHGLQRAGYATDPNYANKLANIINHSLS